MENLLFTLWTALAGVCLFTTLISGYLSFHSSGEKTLTAFSLLSLTIALSCVIDAYLMTVENASALLAGERIWFAISMLVGMALLYFLVSFTAVYNRFGIFVICGFNSLLFFMNLLVDPPFFYADVGSFGYLQLPWGERLPVQVDFQLNFWAFVALVPLLGTLGYAGYAATLQYKRGEKRQALFLVVSFGLVTASVLKEVSGAAFAPDSVFAMLPLGGFAFQFMLIVMTLELCDRVSRADSTATQLVQTQYRFRHVVEQFEDGYFVISPKDGSIIDVNKRACDSLGYSREELLSLTANELVPETEAAKTMSRLSGLGFDDSPSVQGSHLRKDGSTYPIETKLGLFLQGDTQLVVMITRDISEQVKAEQERQLLQLSVYQSQKIQALGTLAGGIAHDFNNILGGVLGHCELALERINEKEKVKKHLEKVIEAAKRAAGLVKQIMTFSSKGERKDELINVKDIIDEALELMEPRLSSNITIQRQFDSNGHIFADPTHIHQIIVNLCSNAIHAMAGQGGTLTLQLNEIEVGGDLDIGEEYGQAYRDLNPGPYVFLCVEDTGPGIDSEIASRVFEPFFTTKSVDEGTGLGLSVVHGIVTQYQGAISLGNAPKQGCRIEIYFPRAESAAQSGSKLGVDLREGHQRILLVDDDHLMADATRQILEIHGFSVDTYTESEAALQCFMVAPDKYDLVITDLSMPKLSGDQLAAAILEKRHDIPVLLITGFGANMNKEMMEKIGIQEFLFKPFNKEKLIGVACDLLGIAKKE